MLRFKSKQIKTYLLLALTLVLAAVIAPAAFAQEGTPVVSDDAVNQIAKQMFCPVCENVPLDVCPTQACHQWRETIRLMLGEGKTEEEIKAYFVLQYGDRVLAAPPPRGFNWLVYVVPPLLILVGLFFFSRMVKNWQTASKRAATSPAPTIEDDEFVRKLEDELKRRS